ncbi:MAG: heparinase II/III family protein [Candidatus Glassbacteria bacterium]|nr:heparinase II/III family protein [Candidatus Glassbacteria bacterium]
MKKILLLNVFLCLAWAASGLAVEVFQGHPRLFFRDSTWGERSLTTEQLRARARDPRYKAYVDRLTYSSANYALKALLLDNTIAAKQCILMLKNGFQFDGTTTDGELVMWAAMAFDWVYNHPVFADSAARAVAVENLIEGARHCRDEYIGQGPHIFHTRMYGFAVGAAMAGLVLKGHHPDADKYIDWAYGIFRDNLFPARRLQDGTVHNSLAYGRRYTMWHTGHFMSAWYSATGEDLYRMVRQEQDDWAWKEALFIMYGRQPDGLLVRYGDNFRRTSERFSFRVIGERAFAYQEPVGAGYLDFLLETQAQMPDPRVVEEGNAYNVLLWWDADAVGVSHDTLPTRKLFSPEGTGMVFWRTGWEEGGDDTCIFFKCGDYFGDHGHFDQGHLEVFRGAPLLIESGAYEGGFDGSHRLNYWRKTIAHNSVLAVDPAVPDDEGGQRIYRNQSESTIEGYLADEGSETGDIVDYRDEDGLAYVAGDFSAAYDPQRIELALRELAWVGERYLVVVDNVSLGDNELLPRVLWHYTVKPVIEGNRFTVADGGSRAVVTVLSPAEAVLDTVRAYQVGTAYYPPPAPDPSWGIGRVEVSVAEPGEYDYLFVQVIDIADEGVPARDASLQVDQATGSLHLALPSGDLDLEGEPGSRSLVRFTPGEVETGDLNGDGQLTIADVIALVLKGRADPADPQADWNGDGRYSIQDAIGLLLYIRDRAGSAGLASSPQARDIQ